MIACNFVEIGNIAEQLRNGLSVRQSEHQGGLPISRIETISNWEIDSKRVGYADISNGDYDDWLLSNGDILISHINSRMHLGKCAIYEGSPPKIIHGMNLLNLRVQQDFAFPKYIYFMLRSPDFRRQIPRIIKDSVNQSSFTTTDFKSLKLPLPSLPEQCRIAAILDKADAICRKRAEALRFADDFLKSAFLDIFGDPVANTKGWPLVLMSHHGSITTGNTPSREKSEYYGDSTVVFWPTIGAPSSCYDRLLLGEHMGKDIFSPLSELESLMGIEDQRLDECLGLLTTRFPDGFDG